MPRPLPANSAPSLPVLAKAPLPTEQLTQIQRRLGHLLNSLAELQGHVANAQTLEEWPSLLSRHLALASQTSSLTTFLSHANTNIFNAQLSAFNEALTNEALYNNKFASVYSNKVQGGRSEIQNDALFAGSKDEMIEGQSNKNLLKVQYSDENNPLRRIVPHPFYPLESEKSQMILPALLLPKADDAVNQEHEEYWKSWARNNGVSENRAQVKDCLAALTIVRNQIRKHDEISGQAIQSLMHAKEATDELGQRYDWKIRLDPNELSEDDEEEEEADAMDEDDDSQETKERKRKREEDMEKGETLTLEQLGKILSTGQM